MRFMDSKRGHAACGCESKSSWPQGHMETADSLQWSQKGTAKFPFGMCMCGFFLDFSFFSQSRKTCVRWRILNSSKICLNKFKDKWLFGLPFFIFSWRASDLSWLHPTSHPHIDLSLLVTSKGVNLLWRQIKSRPFRDFAFISSYPLSNYSAFFPNWVACWDLSTPAVTFTNAALCCCFV